MAIALAESFEGAAAREDVWRFMLDPRSVAACLPGATMEEALDDLSGCISNSDCAVHSPDACPLAPCYIGVHRQASPAQ